MDWHQLWVITSAPDNVPIVGLVFLVPFYVWYGLRQSFANDRLIAQLEADPALAKTHHRKTQPFQSDWSKEVPVWPFLLRIEFLAALIVTVILFVWSITLNAPLEEPANPSITMNPAKAPWSFLGLQEMLVYFDPWMAGVVFPTLIIVGLMAIPFIDVNPKGNGYFTFKERRVEIGIFLYGFLVLWVLLVVSGTFLRGPNWNFFGPYEYWDQHRVEPLLNVHVSDFFWVKLLGRPLPQNPIVREFIGIILVLVYMGVLPVLMAQPKEKLPRFLGWLSLNKYYVKMGPARYYLGVSLFLLMLSLPIKMYLRWMFNLKYIVTFPEIFFNI